MDLNSYITKILKKVARVIRSATIILCASVIAMDESSAFTACDGGNGVPPEAAAEKGFSIRTFQTDFTNMTVDVDDTRRAGFGWYLGQFFGWSTTNRDAIRINSDKSITLRGEVTRINTAAPAADGRGWIGSAFGGGAYFRAILKFDPNISLEGAKSWPAFWSMAIEHLAREPSEQWKGQKPGYTHFIELDFFEYDLPKRPFAGKRYGGAIHEWYGVYGETCAPKMFCSINNVRGGGSKYENFIIDVPGDADFGQYHEYGVLWVPAVGNEPGYAQYYFDGKPTKDLVVWSKYEDQPPPPNHKPWAFGIMDRQHLALILQTGADSEMTVGCVEVWQATDMGNIVR